ncbi:hypothetical protein D3C85_1871150 [compost metagenome]
MPCRRSVVIMSWKSAVVPGRRSPRPVARSLIFWKSAGTWPVLSIMATLSWVAAFSAGANASTMPLRGLEMA